MKASAPSRRLAALLAGLAALAPAARSATVFSDSGANTSDIVGTVDSFRSALGTLNPNNGSAASSGRREINWDAVPDSASSPNAFAGDFFGQAFNGANGGRTRGAVFSTPAGGFLVSPNNPGPASANASFLQDLANSSVVFTPFSNDQVFLAADSTIIDVTFVVPGTAAETAFVTGFGVVFLDVEQAGASSLEFFAVTGESLGSFAAPVSGAGGFSFLGVNFTGGEAVGRVRITAGSETFSAFGAGSTDRESLGDLVGMDDFLYSEPLSVSAIPEPSAFAALAGLAALAGAGLRRRRRSASA